MSHHNQSVCEQLFLRPLPLDNVSCTNIVNSTILENNCIHMKCDLFSLKIKSETFLHPDTIHVLKYGGGFFGLILTLNIPRGGSSEDPRGWFFVILP